VRAQAALLNCVEKSLPEELDQRRKTAMVMATVSAMYARDVSLTAIGRHLSLVGGRAQTKNNIKRADRLVGNTLLHGELDEIYTLVAHQLLFAITRPLILIDWTALDRSKTHALVASIPADGRAQIIYSMAVPQALLGSAGVERRFLQELSNIVPAHCHPIIVSDAGFKTSFCDEVTALGWDFITRIRGTTRVKRNNKSFESVQKLMSAARRTSPVDYGTVVLTPSRPRAVRLVMSKKPTAKRLVKTLSGKPRQGHRDKKQRKSHLEPWLLASSLHDSAAEQILSLYARRMLIEETFRDVKTARFGLSLEHSRGRPERLAVLLVIATLATLAQLCLGAIAEDQHIHYRFQANTVRLKRVLSLTRLALELLRTNAHLDLTNNHVHDPPSILRDKVISADEIIA
jgi:Transposase DDE domain